MSAVTIVPVSGPFTRGDLDALPDDGRRHELIDGALVMTPAPAPRHQIVQMRVIRRLLASLPEDLELLAAPVDVVLADDTVVQPDLVIAPRSAFTSRDLPTTPLLVVEILSPSSRRFDRWTKRSVYEAAGCPSYWIIDPAGPSMTVWELREGAYVVAVEGRGLDVLRVDAPYGVTIDLGELAE